MFQWMKQNLESNMFCLEFYLGDDYNIHQWYLLYKEIIQPRTKMDE